MHYIHHRPILGGTLGLGLSRTLVNALTTASQIPSKGAFTISPVRYVMYTLSTPSSVPRPFPPADHHSLESTSSSPFRGFDATPRFTTRPRAALNRRLALFLSTADLDTLSLLVTSKKWTVFCAGVRGLGGNGAGGREGRRAVGRE